MRRRRKVAISLSKTQWKRITSAFSTISQAIILFSAGAFFVPETVNLSTDFSRSTASLYFIGGLLLFTVAVIIARKEE